MFFSHELHKFINIHVRDVPVTQNINCIVVIDSYGLQINRLQIIIFSTNSDVVARLVIVSCRDGY